MVTVVETVGAGWLVVVVRAGGGAVVGMFGAGGGGCVSVVATHGCGTWIDGGILCIDSFSVPLFCLLVLLFCLLLVNVFGIGVEILS